MVNEVPEENVKDENLQDVPKKGDGEKKDLTITATIDPTQMEDLMGRLKKKELEAEQLAEKLKTATEGKDALQEKLTTVEKDAEDYKNKLSIIAKKKLEVKKAAIMEEAKKHIKDEERLKIIEDGMKTVDDLKGTEFLIDTLKTTLAEGKKQHEVLQDFETRKKTLKAPDTIKTPEELVEWEKANKALIEADPTRRTSSGTLTLEGQTAGSEEGYDSEAAMIRDLRKRSHSKEPEVAAEAKAILKEMFRKWTFAVKKEYDGKVGGKIRIEKGPEQPSVRDMTLEGGAALEKKGEKKGD